MSTTENNAPSTGATQQPAAPPPAGNSMLTYLLYALLVGLVGLLAYRAIKLKNEKAAAQRAEQEYQQLLTETGYPADDTTSGVASTAAPTASATDSKPLNLTEPNASNGIAAAADKTIAAGKDAAEKGAKAVESSTKSTVKAIKTDSDDDQISATTDSKIRSGGDKKRNPVTHATVAKSPSKDPYVVIAASFASKDGARKVMEALVKKGFADAEVTNKLRNGKYWYVIADRAKTEAEAKKAAAEVAKIKDCEKAYVSKIK